MKIYSYNLNGLRAAINKGFIKWLEQERPDIICLQEIKVTEDQLDMAIFENLGYRHFWDSADKKGYSGVAILSKLAPRKIIRGFGIPKYDKEGRLLISDFGEISLLCTYIPSGTMGDARQNFKMEFLEDFLSFILAFRLEHPNLIISGDFNICHKPIDINHPEKHTKMSGFLPEEREWMDRLVNIGFIDSFREFNKEPNLYTWWSYRAGSRQKNLGWRIDYNMVSESLKARLKGAGILQHVQHSDHCPVWLDLEIDA